MIKKLIAFIFVAFFFFISWFYFWGSSKNYNEAYYTKVNDYKLPSITSSDTFTIMTYNIGYLSGMTNNLPIRPSLALYESHMNRAYQLFDTLSADFVCFQEIDFGSERSYQVNQLDSLALSGGYKYGGMAVNWDKNYVPFPYWPPSVHFGKMLSGQAILSKYPILENKRIILEKPASAPFYYNAFYLDRLIQVSIIDVGRIIVILNVHLEAFDTKTRENQAKKLAETVRQYMEKYPLILLGDFNARPPYASEILETEATIDYFLEIEGLKQAIDKEDYVNNEDAYFTFDTKDPYEKLDFIFYSDDFTEVSSRVVKEAGDISDHLPILMSFTWAIEDTMAADL